MDPRLKNPNEFIDEVYKVVAIVGVSSIEKFELAAYQLKDVSKFGMSNGRIVDLWEQAQ